MYHAIGDVLSLGLAVALSPFPIIATVLMLLSPNAKASGTAFLGGWVLGTLAAVTLFTFVSSLVENSAPGDPHVIASIVRILLGVVLLVLAVRKWRQGRRADFEPSLPKWMASITTATPARGFITGLLLAGANPKNLLIAAAAGVGISSAELTLAQNIIPIAIYTVIGSLTVIIPVAAYAVWSTTLTDPLRSLEQWLVRNSSTMMALILLIFGFVVIGNGIAEL